MTPKHVVKRLKRLCDRFAAETDGEGRLLHPHFGVVQQAMGALMETYPPLKKMPDGIEKLKRAYQMATADLVTESETSEMLRQVLSHGKRKSL